MLKSTIAIALLLVLAAGASMASTIAGFYENFDSYNLGPLSVVSGGVWKQWMLNSPENDVVTGGYSYPNAMQTGVVDWGENVAYYSNLFGGGNTKAAYGFKFYVHEDSDAQDNDTYIGFTAGNPATGEINYDAGTGFFIIDWGTSVGTASLHHWDLGGTSGGGDFGITELATGLALDTWHSVDVYLTLTVADPVNNPAEDADGYFDIYLDGTKVLSNRPFAINDLAGLNAVDIYGTTNGQTALQDYILIDDVYATPEPTGLLALAGFIPGLIFLRRRK